MEHVIQVGVENAKGSSGSTDFRSVTGKPPSGPPDRHLQIPKLDVAFEKKLAAAEEALRDNQMESDPVRLKNLAEEITYALSGIKSLKLSMDAEQKRVVVRVVDKRTDHVIRQIPTERMVDLVKQMRDLEGLLFKASA